MNSQNSGDLQRLNLDADLSERLKSLPAQVQNDLIRKHQEGLIKISHDALSSEIRSRATEVDLNTFQENVERLDNDRKVYTAKNESQTGSGKIDIVIRGGDTRFIVPVLLSIGLILLILFALIAA